MLQYLAVLVLAATAAVAAPLQPRFSDCVAYYNSAPGSQRLNVSNIYANLVAGSSARQLGLPGDGADVLRVDLFGTMGQELIGYDEGTNKLATLFTETTVGNIEVYKSTSWVCNSLFPANLTTPYNPNATYCPLPAGPFGLNISIPLYRSYALTTLSTQIRIVDTSLAANTLSCINVSFTPYDKHDWVYDLLLWLPAALLVGFWAVSWGARFAAGWVIGSGVAEYGTKEQHGNESRAKDLDKAGRREARMRKWGTMIVSGLSGERLSVSSALLRFGLREIVYHIQFCTILVMVAVSWPEFAYPIVARLAWADLVWNNTLTLGGIPSRVTHPTNTSLYPPFSTQMSNRQLPLYLDATATNNLLDLGSSASGLESFATTIGLRPQDLFGLCMAIFLLIAATVIFISVLFWLMHALVESTLQDRSRTAAAGASVSNKRLSYGSSPSTSMLADKAYDLSKSNPTTPGVEPQGNPLLSQSQVHIASRQRSPKFRRIWWRFRPKGEAGAFHATTLYGNLLRLILIFHLPITTFSMYQLAVGSQASIVSRVFAALALVFISILIPIGVLWKVHKTPSGKLYDATRTLLALGTLYNHYEVEKQMFRCFPLGASLITGIVIGAGQGSGIAQAVILVVVELCMLILPAVWYPWGDGASMGAPSIFLGVIRVVSALLVMLMSPVFSMANAALTWLAYAVILLNVVAFLFFLFMLLTKIFEGLIRLAGGVHFDESTHPLDGGIFAAIADLDCLNGVTGGKAAARKRRKRGSRQLQRNVSAAGSLTTQQMLDRHSQGVPRVSPESSFIYPSAYPRLSQGYFPAVQPPLGPPPPLERHSSDSRYEDAQGVGNGDNIMDAWRPRSRSGEYVTPGTYAPTVGSPMREGLQNFCVLSPSASLPVDLNAGSGQGFQVVRGGRASMSNSYEIASPGRTGSEIEELDEIKRSRSPSNVVAQSINNPGRLSFSRGYSSQAVIEDDVPSQGHALGGQGSSTHGYLRPASGQYPPARVARLPSSTSSPAGLNQYQAQPQVYGNQSQPQNVAQSKRLSGSHEAMENIPLRPPVLTIPKRRSLNDLKQAEADSPASDYSDAEGTSWGKDRSKRGKQKDTRARRSRGPRAWFGRGQDEGSETQSSDDEPGPSRRRSAAKLRESKSAAVPATDMSGRRLKEFKESPLGASILADDQETGEEKTASKGKSWRRFLGVNKDHEDSEEEERAKDENRVRKAALANESGALFVGVESPVKSSRLKGRPSGTGPYTVPIKTGDELPASTESGKRGFVVHRRGPATPSSSSGGPSRPGSKPLSPTINRAPSVGAQLLSPLLSPPGSFNSGEATSENRSFKVKRLARHNTPSPIQAGVVPASTSASPQVGQADSASNGSGFEKVSYPPAGPGTSGNTRSVDLAPPKPNPEGEKKSFRVIRPAQPARRSIDTGKPTLPVLAPATSMHSSSSTQATVPASGGTSFVVNRPTTYQAKTKPIGPDSNPIPMSTISSQRNLGPTSSAQSTSSAGVPRLDVPIGSESAGYTDNAFSPSAWNMSDGPDLTLNRIISPISASSVAGITGTTGTTGMTSGSAARRLSTGPDRPARNPRRESMESQRGHPGYEVDSLGRPTSIGKAL